MHTSDISDTPELDDGRAVSHLDSTPTSKPPAGLAFVVFIITVVVFARAWNFLFVHWDDPSFVYDNPAVTPPSWQNIVFVWTNAYKNIYVPLFPTAGNLLAWISDKIGPSASPALNGISLNATPFHVANILLHAGSAAVLFSILFRLTRHKTASVLGALVFAVHPLNVETVAWVASLDHDISMLLGLIALDLYILHAQASQSASGARKTSFAYLGALFLGTLAMFAKPTAVVIPVTAFTIDLLLIKRPFKTTLLESGLWLLLTIPSSIVVHEAYPIMAASIVSPWQRIFVTGDAMAFYMAKLVMPINLAMDYGRRPIEALTHWWTYVDWIAPAILVLVGFAFRNSAPWLLCGILVFIINFLPVSGLLPFPYQSYSTVADRYVYMSLTGVALIVAFWISTSRHAKAAQAATVLCLVAMLIITEIQIGYWKNSIVQFNHEIAINPNSRAIYDNYGQVELALGNNLMAESMFRRAIAAAPDLPGGYYGMGHIYAMSGDSKNAIAYFKLALNTSIHFDVARLELGDEFMKTHDYADAVAEYEALAIDTPHLPVVHAKLADALARLGQDNHAVSEYSLCSTLDPKNAAYPEQAGKIMLKEGNSDGALQAFQEAEHLAPSDPDAHFGLGEVDLVQKRFADAAAEFRECVAVDPLWSAAHENLGVALANSGDMKSAVTELAIAARLAPEKASYRSNYERILKASTAQAK